MDEPRSPALKGTSHGEPTALVGVPEALRRTRFRVDVVQARPAAVRERGAKMHAPLRFRRGDRAARRNRTIWLTYRRLSPRARLPFPLSRRVTVEEGMKPVGLDLRGWKGGGEPARGYFDCASESGPLALSRFARALR